MKYYNLIIFDIIYTTFYNNINLTKEQMISQQIQYHHSLLLNSSINTNNQEYIYITYIRSKN